MFGAADWAPAFAGGTLTYHTDKDTARFYRRFGFEAPPLREQLMLPLLKEMRRLVR